MLFIKKVDLPNMWYMPVIIGIYIILPFLSIIVKKVDKKVLAVPLIITIVLNMLLPNVNTLLKVFNKSEIVIIVDKSFLGHFYGIYLVLGFYLFNKLIRNKTIKIVIVYTIINVILTIIYQFVLLNNNINYDLWYNNIFLCAASMGVFEMVLRMKKNNNQHINSIVNLVSRYSLGIYFLHIIVQNLLKPVIDNMYLLKSVKVWILFCCTLLICFVMIYSLKKIKILQRYIFFVR